MEVAEEAYLSLFVKFYLWKTMQNLWKTCGKIPHFLWISLWKSTISVRNPHTSRPLLSVRNPHTHITIYTNSNRLN